MAKTWALQDAKGAPSEVVRRANADGPQVVTFIAVSKGLLLSRPMNSAVFIRDGAPSWMSCSTADVDDRTVENDHPAFARTGAQGQA